MKTIFFYIFLFILFGSIIASFFVDYKDIAVIVVVVSFLLCVALSFSIVAEDLKKLP